MYIFVFFEKNLRVETCHKPRRCSAGRTRMPLPAATATPPWAWPPVTEKQQNVFQKKREKGTRGAQAVKRFVREKNLWAPGAQIGAWRHGSKASRPHLSVPKSYGDDGCG